MELPFGWEHGFGVTCVLRGDWCVVCTPINVAVADTPFKHTALVFNCRTRNSTRVRSFQTLEIGGMFSAIALGNLDEQSNVPTLQLLYHDGFWKLRNGDVRVMAQREWDKI